MAYDTACDNQVTYGEGYIRILTEYTRDDSFDQEILFKRVQNPFTVYVDPFSTEPDGSDMSFCFVTELVPREEFKSQYPKAEMAAVESLVVGAGDSAVVWLSDDSVRIAEYYKIKTEPAY